MGASNISVRRSRSRNKTSRPYAGFPSLLQDKSAVYQHVVNPCGRFAGFFIRRVITNFVRVKYYKVGNSSGG